MEVAYQNNGYIFGIDEAGRGSWAGPLVVCALAAPMSWGPDWIKDSKKYPSHEARKEAMDILSKDSSLFWTIRWISPQQIDEVGLDTAQRVEMTTAIEVLFYMLRPVLPGYPERIIIDGTWDDVFEGSESIIDADDIFPVVSAASVVAKASHDEYMIQLSTLRKYAGYGFESHMGYGTKEHKEMIELLGVSSIHRRSFEPIRKFVDAGRIASDYAYTDGSTNSSDDPAFVTSGAESGRRVGRSSKNRSRQIRSRARKIKVTHTST